MIKLIIFDLDGVLVSSKMMHFGALNKALGPQRISYEDHIKRFDGLPTAKKLDMLGIPECDRKRIWEDKQRHSIDYVKKNITPDEKLVAIFSELKNMGTKVVVASNSIREITKLYILRLGIMEFVDEYISNQDVENPKPNPEMYLRCMANMSVAPKDTLIVEDSFYGLTAAHLSGARIMQVHSPDDVTLGSVKDNMNGTQEQRGVVWVDGNATVLIPMAGNGSRFSDAGYTFPKPIIDVNGKPMVQVVIDSIGIKSKNVFVVNSEHNQKYNLSSMLYRISDGCSIVNIDKTTEGAACTTLLAKKLINNDSPLIIANSDQYIEWNSVECMYEFMNGNNEALILTFKSNHPQWSYVSTDEDGFVKEVAEKNVISDTATVGVYIWKKGSDYVKYAEQMIEKNVRHNNEFYVAPVFNEAISDGKKVATWKVDKMCGLGTPELLERFLRKQ